MGLVYLQEININLIITLVIIIILIVTGIIIFIKIRNSLRKISRTFFNTDDILEGVKKQQNIMVDTPKSISVMTNVYLPLIKNDFPDFNYDEFKQKAENLLLNYFTAISTLTPIENINITNNVALQVNSIISQLQANHYTEYYKDVVIHNTAITKYDKNPAVCKIVFQTALENVNYIEDTNGKIIFGRKDLKEQTIYETELVYVQDFEMVSDTNLIKALMLNCPNCGGPITNPSAKFCEYCGTGIKQKNVLVWNFNSIKEVSGNKSH